MDEFIRRSRLTGEHYDVYKCVRIVNIQQVSAYLDNDADLLDVYVSKDNNDKRILVFLFDRNSTKQLYDKWCKHEL